MDKNGNLIMIFNREHQHYLDNMLLLYREYFRQNGRYPSAFVMHPETFYLLKKECQRILCHSDIDRRFMGVEILRSEDIDFNEVRAY